MGVSSGKSRVADLAFQVFARALHPDWFLTRAHRRVGREGWQADARIVEGGHVLHWACGPIRLTEILGDSRALLPERGLLLPSPVKQERSTSLRPGEPLEYHACFEAERLDREVFYHVCDELALDGASAKGGLFHRFAPGNRLAPPAVSRIHIEARARGLTVHTFHTFPDECAIVRTQSLFEVRVPVPR